MWVRPRLVDSQERSAVAARAGEGVGLGGGRTIAGGVGVGNLPGGLVASWTSGAVSEACPAARALGLGEAAVQASEAEGEITVSGWHEGRRGRRSRLVVVTTTRIWRQRSQGTTGPARRPVDRR